MSFSPLFVISVVMLAYLELTVGMRYCDDCLPYNLCTYARWRAESDKSETSRQMFRKAFCGMYNTTIVKVCCSDFDPPVNLLSRLFGPEMEDEHRNIGLLPDSCGDNVKKRIVGGVTAAMYEYPWMVLIAYPHKGTTVFDCSGSLINSQYVLTAAHCILHKDISGVRIGEYNLQENIDCQFNVCETHLQDRQVAKMIIHKKYEGITDYKHDIALLRLKQPIDLTHRNAGTICLPTTRELRSRSIANKPAIVAGWGLTEFGREATVLRKVTIPVHSNEVCRDLYGGAGPDSNQFCAGQHNKDSCRGDSGGPLMIEDEYKGLPKYVQYGIVSNGPTICGSDLPGIYTDVRKYVNWILDNLEP